MRLWMTLAVLGLSATHAFATPCQLDRVRYHSLAGTAGYGEALVCGGVRLDDVWAQFAGDGRLTGISWSEYAGDHKRRTIRIDSTGRVFFLSQDTSIKGGFFAQTRGTSHFVFPRDRTMSVTRSGSRLVVRDPSGRAWHLVGKPLTSKGSPRVSYSVISIDDREQAPRAIDFTKKGIVAVDLVAPYAVYLQHEEPQMHGLADRRSRAYLTTRSVFHDGRGKTCAVTNDKLFRPRAADPHDKADNELRFDDDGALRDFLAAECPALDLRVLERSPAIAK